MRLDAVELREPTPDLLRDALADSASHARYWQELDSEDCLAATPEMNHALRRVAELVAASPMTAWWRTPAALHAQHAVQWDGATPKQIRGEVREALLAADDRERRAVDARTASSSSGEWWSRPSEIVPSSACTLSDGSPAALWFVEDHLGWDRATSVRLIVPEGVRVLEIECATDWAELCAKNPLDVTERKRHDWGRLTALTARWITPAWAQVAEHYDAVHLQVAAYLAAAGTAIRVDKKMGKASVIAGWNPDETYWLTSNIAYSTHRDHWVLEDRGSQPAWVASPPEQP